MFNLYFLNLRERISSSQSSQNNKKGFTLIKMLIVIAIIAILAAIVIIAINLVKQMQKPSPISMRQSTGEGGKANGQICSIGSECNSGNCVTGYCCSSPSCNTCYSCPTGSCAAQTCDGAAATLLGCTQGSEACRYCNAGTCGYYTSGQHGCPAGQTCNSSGQCAATGPLIAYLDPNGDGTPLQWTPVPSGTHYTTIDDGVRQPDTPDITDYITLNVNGVDTYNMSSIPSISSVSSITIWAYGLVPGAPGFIYGNIYIGGAWQSAQSFNFSTSGSWQSITFTGTWTQADLDALQVQIGCGGIIGSGPARYIYSLYVVAIYTQ